MYKSDPIGISRDAVLSVMEKEGKTCAVAIGIPSLRIVSTTLPKSSLDGALRSLKRNVERRSRLPVSREGSSAERGGVVEAEKMGWKVAAKIHEFCLGKPVRFSERLDLFGLTIFQREVLLAALSIPRGKVASYSWVAKRAGFPRAYRAVGNVMAANPFPPIVPCHRVVRSNRELGNFGDGTPLKKKLLLLEGVEFDGSIVSTDCLM